LRITFNLNSLVTELPTQPLISIVIPAYNAEAFIAEAIESVLAQDYQIREIIVVDDGSTDNTPGVLESYQNRIRFIRQSNAGLGTARNTGIAAANGELIAFLDADDRWLPEKLSKQYKCLIHNPKAGLVHTDLLEWRPQESSQTHREIGRGEFQGSCLPSLIQNNRVLPSTVLVKKECLDRVGNFDPQPTGVEDWDLWLRIAREYEFAYVAEPLVLYRMHDANMSANSLRMRSGEFYVLQKTLTNMPELTQHVDRATLRQRLFELAFDIGYHHFLLGNLSAAREHFKKAISFRRLSSKAWCYLSACYLPPNAVNSIRDIKQKLFHRIHTKPAS
jgi:glycosyltransferase involved in cell wall biosynthesis